MERQKKKRKNYMVRRQSKSTSSLPNDLTAQILSWLPEKSVARFSCVSKLWLSITTDPYFINLLESRSPRPIIQLCITQGDDLFVASIPQDTKSSNKFYSSSQAPIHSYHMKLPKEHSFYPSGMESVHGLVFFTKSRNMVVWNPSTRQFLTLPDPKIGSRPGRNITFFGYDPIEGKHKVVCVPYKKTCYVCRVFTLGSRQDSWRTVRADPKHRPGYVNARGPWGCIKGVIYYLANSCPGFKLVLMSFDVRSEKFHVIKLPSKFSWGVHVLLTYKGRLACGDCNNKKRLWILEDAEKHKWSFQDFLSPILHRDPSLGTRFKLKGCTHAGEFIYVLEEFHKSLYILFYYPVRNSCRRFEFERIFEDQSGLYNGVENGLIYSFDACPNHIESQISL